MSYSSEVLADSPLAYYRLGEASGTTVTDSSGNGRNGTYVNAPALGAVGLLRNDADAAVDFSGSNWAAVTAATWMENPYFSAECWISPDVVSGSHAIINRADYDQSNTAAGRSWYIHQSGNRLIYGVFESGFSTYYNSPAVGPTLVAGTSYHVVLTYDGTTIRFYVNGSEVHSQAMAGTLRPAAGIDLTIGADHAGNIAERFDGRIDEPAFYGAALSPARITAHYAAAMPPYAAAVLADSPVVSYRFDETSGTSLLDQSGNGQECHLYRNPRIRRDVPHQRRRHLYRLLR